RIPAPFYFSFWASTSITFLGLGFWALDQEKLSIPPLVVFIFKRFLAISVCHSSSYALVHRLGANIPLEYRMNTLFKGFAYPVNFHFYFGPFPFWLVLSYATLVAVVIFYYTGAAPGFCLSADFFVKALILSIGEQDDRFLPAFVLITAFFTAAMAAEQDGPSYDYWQLPGIVWRRRFIDEYVRGSRVLEMYKKRKTVRFAVAMFGSILFQNYVKFTAFSHLLAFLYCAAAWLGCIALVMSSEDLGVFDFLLSNVMVGCTVNQFGLRGPTWVAYGASVLLFGLRRGLNAVRLDSEHDAVLIWGLGDGLSPVWYW
ncbi:hypothetical protein Pfo_018521, partial [Paulownia fortunei]